MHIYYFSGGQPVTHETITERERILSSQGTLHTMLHATVTVARENFF